MNTFNSRICAFIFMFLFVSVSAFSQKMQLSKEQEESIKQRCDVMIRDYQQYLSIIGGKGKPKGVRQHYVKQAYKLFLGNCDPYVNEKSKESPKEIMPAVQMEVSSIKSKNVVTKTQKVYLNRLMALPYDSVVIKRAQTHKLSDLERVDDHWEATATYYQVFQGFDENGIVIYGGTQGELTEKSVGIRVDPAYDGVVGMYFEIKLGDISVVQTNQIK